MKAETQFGKVPPLIAAFAPQYKQHHFHISGRNIDAATTFKSVLQDQQYQMHKFLNKAIKGAIVGCIFTYAWDFNFNLQEKSFQKLRMPKSSFKQMWYKSRTNTIYGAVFGAAWYFIYDRIFCPHGQTNITRFLGAHAVGGALFAATFYNPAAWLYGIFGGLVFGGLRAHIITYGNPMPQNFRIELSTVDEQQRKQWKINDAEQQLSSKTWIFENIKRKMQTI